jgi:hypothetical protein
LYMGIEVFLFVYNGVIPSHAIHNSVENPNSYTTSHIITTLALGSRPRQRFTRALAKRSVRECEHEDSHSQVSSHFRSWSLGGLPNFQRAITKVKTPRIEDFFISSKSY